MKATLIILATIFSVAFAELNPSICTSPGLACVSCDELAICILKDNAYTITHLEYCLADQSCSGTACTTNVNPRCDYAHLQFKCNDIGMFPDPFNCHKYHFCVPDNWGLSHTVVDCDAGFAYDPKTMFCSVKLNNNVCPPESSVPLCTKVGDSAALSNQSLYYICAEYDAYDKTLYPFLFNCPHGGTYQDYTCILKRRQKINLLLAGKKITQ